MSIKLPSFKTEPLFSNALLRDTFPHIDQKPYFWQRLCEQFTTIRPRPPDNAYISLSTDPTKVDPSEGRWYDPLPNKMAPQGLKKYGASVRPK